MIRSISRESLARIQSRFRLLYGGRSDRLLERLYSLIGRYGVGDKPTLNPVSYWTENDVVLITYGDMVRQDGEAPLETLGQFCRRWLGSDLSTIHILPFYPWSSDDGFSVIDYRTVDPALGDWSHVERIGRHYKLAFDLVLNHCSSRSEWFRDYLLGVDPGKSYFIEEDPATDLSAVVRPRTSPLLTEVTTRNGRRHVWTTFSADQVDLNWRNPDLLFEFLDILFLYISRGVRILRLDAVAFLWKEIGTDCLHLRQTHEVVKLFRDILELVAPEVILLTETNVPHAENISYFGRGDEAQMVYNFSLPPLLLHAYLTEDAGRLRTWAAGLPELPEGNTFFNFTASHDGIGLRPLQGLVPDDELGRIVAHVESRGGRVNYRATADGRQQPYELNITYYSALADPDDGDLGVQRFLGTQAVALAFKGMPAIYFHSLTGTRNNLAGVAATGQNRTINRYKWPVSELTAELENPDSHHARIFRRYLQMIRRRANHPAFHPDAGQEVLDLGPAVFGFRRRSRDGNEEILCLFNVTSRSITVSMNGVLEPDGANGSYYDILGARSLKSAARGINLKPFQAIWLGVR